MYLRKVHIENIRSIAELDWEIPEGSEAGWHVVIGDNGSGKSTFLRALALVLIGQSEAAASRQNWSDWMRKGEAEGIIQLELRFDPQVDSPMCALGLTYDNGSGYEVFEFNVNEGSVGILRSRISASSSLPALPAEVEEKREKASKAFLGEETLLLGLKFSRENGSVRLSNSSEGIALLEYLEKKAQGCFSASYGPFRRFTGGDQETQKIFETNPRLAAHLSIFGENIALTESLKWLHDLDYRQAKKMPGGALLNRVKAFINQEGFLPHHAKLTDVSPEAVLFTDGDDKQVSVEELSDGYRSILSMTFELIRQMSLVYPIDIVFSPDSSKIAAPGIVLIDEVDAHLHPTWQRSIGLWFREHFPNIQFIITTHSPLVCQAAEHGTVWRLPKPGSSEKAKQVTGVELNRLLYGNVLDAYGTELFGEDVGRSEAGKDLMQQLAALNVKEVNQGLSKAEKKKQQELRATFPTSSPATNGQRNKGK